MLTIPYINNSVCKVKFGSINRTTVLEKFTTIASSVIKRTIC